MSVAAIIALFPLMVAVAIAIKMESRGPIIYKQVRVGKNGRHFNFYKFRSMKVDADKRKGELSAKNDSSDGVIFKMKKDPRMTKIGAVIRKFSIDELPQLFNVLEGSMSLVGPRPPASRGSEKLHARGAQAPAHKAGHNLHMAGVGQERHSL